MFDIAPSPGRPRSSEGAFLPLDDGTILFCYSAFSGESAQDHAHADIALISSGDGGESWSAPRIIMRALDFGAMNIMSVSLLRMRNGDAGMFFLVRQSWTDMRIWLSRSNDGGETWSKAVCRTPRAGYFVMNNDRAVRLESGRILLPAAEHVNTLLPDGKVLLGVATATCFYSDDDGETFRECAAPVSLPGVRTRSGLQEPGVVQLKNGAVYGFARTDLSRQYEFLSLDEGAHFSMAAPSRFTSPVSPLSMKRLRDGRLFAVWNPVPDYPTRHADPRTGGRSPLVCALSTDDGTTWNPPVILEDDPLSGYCYTAIEPLPDAVLLAYCAGSAETDNGCLNRLRIRRVPLSALTYGER